VHPPFLRPKVLQIVGSAEAEGYKVIDLKVSSGFIDVVGRVHIILHLLGGLAVPLAVSETIDLATHVIRIGRCDQAGYYRRIGPSRKVLGKCRRRDDGDGDDQSAWISMTPTSATTRPLCIFTAGTLSAFRARSMRYSAGLPSLSPFRVSEVRPA
jgi:hypothetical protein